MVLRTEPIIEQLPQEKLTDEEKISRIEQHFAAIMETLGLDLSDDSLQGTPTRVAKMYVNEVFSGLNPDTFPEISFFENHSNAGMVSVKASFTSFCEHHFVPMQGTCTIAYLPNKKLIGLSKIPRIVQYFAKRPQLQERLTTQIADCLQELLETDHIAISCQATHTCVTARGIQDQESCTETHLFRGQFQDDPYRSDFRALSL